jgi:hypothetical protein
MNNIKSYINEWLDMKVKMIDTEVNLLKNILNLKEETIDILDSNRFKNFTPEINKWIDENINLKSNKRLIFEKLLELNYDYNLIKNKLNIDYEDCVNNELLNKNSKDEIKTSEENKIILLRNANIINNSKLNIYQIANFLNKEECQKIILSYENNDINNNELLNNIEERICKYVGVENENSEKIYIEKLDDIKKANDYTYIFLVYLNEHVNDHKNKNEYLSFPNVYFSDLIKTGNALFWKKDQNDQYEQISKNISPKYILKKCFKKIIINKNLNNHLPILDNIGFKKIKIDIENFSSILTESKFLLLEWIKYKTNLTYISTEEVNYTNPIIYNEKNKNNKNIIISVFINLNIQDNQLWSFKIEDHNYIEHEIILEKGDVIFYESSTCKHEINFKFIDDNNKALIMHFRSDN